MKMYYARRPVLWSFRFYNRYGIKINLELYRFYIYICVMGKIITGKLIDLPNWAISQFKQMAKAERQRVKPFIENTLIDIAQAYRDSKSNKQSKK